MGDGPGDCARQDRETCHDMPRKDRMAALKTAMSRSAEATALFARIEESLPEFSPLGDGTARANLVYDVRYVQNIIALVSTQLQKLAAINSRDVSPPG